MSIPVYLQLLHTYFAQCGAQCFCYSLKRSCCTGRLAGAIFNTEKLFSLGGSGTGREEVTW